MFRVIVSDSTTMNARSKLLCGAIVGNIIGLVLIVCGTSFVVMDGDNVLCYDDPSTYTDNGRECISGLLQRKGKLKSFEMNLSDLL